MGLGRGLFVVFFLVLFICFPGRSTMAFEGNLRAHFAFEGDFADAAGDFPAGQVIVGDKIGPRPGAVTAGPQFTEVSVHDPMVIRDHDTFYVFGSHLAAAKSKDLIEWQQISTHVHEGNPLVPNVYEEFGESLQWAGTDTTWAKSIIKLNGKYHMYYSVSTWGSPRSAIALATAEHIEGPYKYEGMILNSGLQGDQEGEEYIRTIHPNAIDPHVFFDHEGNLWMVYGSYFGGIHILKMDPETGRPYPGQGYGKRLAGGSHAPMEGPEIHYHPETGYYYLFVSFGTLASHGGYNIRVARSQNPDGPYYDPSGNDMREATGRAIQAYGARLIGNFRFAESKISYLSPGHNSYFYDAETGKGYIFFHARFPGKGEMHNLRVHQILMNAGGWPVCAPHRYAGETARAVLPEEVTGVYQYINHGKSISAAVNESVLIELEPGGVIAGAVEGEWKMTGDYTVDLTVDGRVYHGVFLEQWDDGLKEYVMTFSALSEEGVAVWGSRIQQADNPVVKNVRTADPAPLVYNGRFYIVCGQDEAATTEFDMYGWRLLSSADMKNWTDHGIIVRASDVDWLPPNRAWASQIVYRDGYFYFYVCGDGQIGVLRATEITGPYLDVNGKPLLTNADPWAPTMTIDPCVFIDDDGRAYLWYGLGRCCFVELNDDMISLKGPVRTVRNLPFYLEAPFVIKENGTYFLLYADGPWPSRIRYATSSSVHGPWTHRGVIGEPTGNGTNHPGAAFFNGEWWYVYHTEELSKGNPYSRSVCVDRMIIEGDTIKPVTYSSFWMDEEEAARPDPVQPVAGMYKRLQSFNFPNRYFRHDNRQLKIDVHFDPPADAQWKIVPGLAEAGEGYVSFASVDYPGYYIRQYNYFLRLDPDDGSDDFKADATFKIVPGWKDSNWVSFQSYKYPDRYIRHRNFLLFIDRILTDLDRQDATWRITD